MAYLDDRTHDVFISYAHGDDDVSDWVRDFAKHLEKELKNQLRIKEDRTTEVDVVVWKDNRLPQQGNLSERLKHEINASSFFLVIMSELYLRSEWCEKEGIMFVNALKDKSDIRIFIAEKEKTDKNKWPDYLKTDKGDPLLSQPFHEEFDVGDIETIPMKTPQGSADPRAVRIMKKFCNELSSQLFDLKHLSPVDIRAPSKKIFLAISPEGNARGHRSALSTLLAAQKDIFILPHPEPNTKEAFEAALKTQLPQCSLFVQVLDRSKGLYLSERTTGFVGHQYEVAKANGKKVLQWMDPELDAKRLEDGDYQDFLVQLEPLKNNGTLFTGSLEDLAQNICDQLENVNRSTTQLAKSACFIAIKSDIQDKDYAVNIVGKALKGVHSDLLMNLIIPGQETKAKELDELIDVSDGVVFVWGEVEPRWVINEIRRFHEVPAQKAKVGALAICDPYPKSVTLDLEIMAMNLSAGVNSEIKQSDVSNYVHELRRSLLEKEDSLSGSR
jgi:hypothetical protein